MTNAAAETKLCRWCCEPNHPDATICKNCKKYQNAWIEVTYAIGAAVGALTLMAGVGNYLVEEYRERRAAQSDPTVSVVAMKSTEQLVVQNTGARAIFVSGVVLDFEKSLGEKSILTLNRRLEPGELYVRERDKDGDPAKPVHYTHIPCSGFPSDEALQLLRADPVINMRAIAYGRNDQELRETAGRARIFDGLCAIEFSGAGSSGSKSESFACNAIVGFEGDRKTAMEDVVRVVGGAELNNCRL